MPIYPKEWTPGKGEFDPEVQEQRIKEVADSTWHYEGIAIDLRNQPWHITERYQSGIRIDRTAFLCSYEYVEGEIQEALTDAEWEHVRHEDYIAELVEAYTGHIAARVSEIMGEHVYDMFDEGNVYLGQYEEGDPEELVETYYIED